MSRKWSTRRKSLAIGLAVVGVAGLSLASASQLGLNWNTSTFQAGSVTVKSDCQPQSEPIALTYDPPTFGAATSNGWTVANVTFSNLDVACNGKTAEVAYKTATSGDWVKTTGTIPPLTLGATSSANKFAVALPTGITDPSDITGWALTIHS